MAVVVTHRDVVNQSNSVWNQFGESKWIPFSKENAKLPHRPAEELRNVGIGRFLVLAAMGESLEDSVPFIKKYRDRVDVLTCDKGFGLLLEQGIKADYVMLCDCNILYKWIDKYINETKDVKLISTVYGNIEWTQKWQGPRYYYLNKDAIDTQRHFIPMFGEDARIIPASTNVSNAMLVFMTGCDERSNVNWSGYERFFLTGYDYSWRMNGKYYAYEDPKPKRYYMSHRTMLDLNNDWVRTSENLFFSAKWMFSYMTSFNLPVVNCSGRGILFTPIRDKMENQLKAIKEGKKYQEAAKMQFEMAKAAKKTFEMAQHNFTKAREELYQWPLETKLN